VIQTDIHARDENRVAGNIRHPHEDLERRLNGDHTSCQRVAEPVMLRSWMLMYQCVPMGPAQAGMRWLFTVQDHVHVCVHESLLH
jgi:hypothetical protein